MLIKLVFMVALVLLPSPASSEESYVWGFSDYPPFRYKVDGEYLGIDVLLMKEISKKLGFSIKYSDCPFKRCLELMKSGGVDFMTAIGLRDERRAFVEFIFPPYNENNAKVLYVRKGSNTKLETYEDLYRYSIGVKNGVSYFPRFDADTKLNKQTVNEVEINLRKLEQGRIDVAINTEIQMDYLIIKHGFEGAFEKANFRDESGRDFIGISKESKLMRRKTEIEGVVADIVKNGRIKEIVAEFFDQIRAQMKSQGGPAVVNPVGKPAESKKTEDSKIDLEKKKIPSKAP